jgi:hypothetical protein
MSTTGARRASSVLRDGRSKGPAAPASPEPYLRATLGMCGFLPSGARGAGARDYAHDSTPSHPTTNGDRPARSLESEHVFGCNNIVLLANWGFGHIIPAGLNSCSLFVRERGLSTARR